MAGLALLLCAIPSVQCTSDGKIFGKNIAGDCGAPLSNLIAEYLFSALPYCTEAQYHLAHVKIKLRPAVTSVTVKRLSKASFFQYIAINAQNIRKIFTFKISGSD